MPEEVYGVIYRITNTKNSMKYIGQTTIGIRYRWRLHCSGNSTCRLLRDAIKEFGEESFIVEQVDSAKDRNELNQKECEWIKKENCMTPNGYNKDAGGYFIRYSDEAKKRMSENHADVSGEKNPRFGRHCTKETKKLISDRLRGKYTGKNSANHRPVLNMDTGERFDTAAEAADRYGVTASTLIKTCRGKQKKTAGFRWTYAEGGDAL